VFAASVAFRAGSVGRSTNPKWCLDPGRRPRHLNLYALLCILCQLNRINTKYTSTCPLRTDHAKGTRALASEAQVVAPKDDASRILEAFCLVRGDKARKHYRLGAEAGLTFRSIAAPVLRIASAAFDVPLRATAPVFFAPRLTAEPALRAPLATA